MASIPVARNLPGGPEMRDKSPLAQPTEAGAIIQASSIEVPAVRGSKDEPAARSWAHMVAGGVGGMTAAALTAPLDVLKTRLQSDFYQAQLRTSRAAAHAAAMNPIRAAGYHFQETFQILASVYRVEGARALFKGLGPNLIGVVPARSIQFFTYGNSKRLIADYTNGGNSEAWWVHLAAAVTAGVTTSTATNPIWMVKTRLQLDRNVAKQTGGLVKRQYKNSWDCIKQIVRNEGVRGLYKGMSASYLGVSEITLHWVIYEQLKRSLAKREERILLSGRENTALDHAIEWFGKSGAAGSAKLFAAVVTYPHEVARTRLRQSPMADGKPVYTGLFQCFKLVFKQEGMAGLYGGMTPHLLRTVPSAAIMFGMYEGILRLIGEKA